MTWYWWPLAALAALYLAGRLWSWSRNPPRPDDIRYHFGSRIARVVAMSRKSHGNWAITIGRHTFVRFYYISGPHRLHELQHSRDAKAMSVPVFLVRWIYEMARYGYRNAPLERKAVMFAQTSNLPADDISAS